MVTNKKYNQEYWKRNKEKLSENNKKYRLEHREEYLRYLKDYHQKHKEEANKITRKYRMLHPEKVDGYEKNRRTIHRKKLTEKQFNRRQMNKQKYNAQQQAKRNVTMEDKCQICNSTNDLQRHHWRYDKPLLVATLCKQCHAIQHMKNFNEWHETRLQADKQMEIIKCL
jgi:hypothetical protein